MKPKLYLALVFFLALPFFLSGFGPSRKSPSITAPNSLLHLDSKYGQLPLAFEPNQGQTDSSVRFTARGKGYALYLTPAEAVLRLKRPPAKILKVGTPKNTNIQLESSGSDIVRIRLEGGNRLCRMEGQGKLASMSNYFVGPDPEKWRKGVAQYAQVKMEEVYPGIDMVYYGDQGRLEYDFVVKPGADPQKIRLRVSGTNEIRIESNGYLTLRTKHGNLDFHAPVLYQGDGNRKTIIRGCFEKCGKYEVGFAVKGYDASKPLVIDPPLVYSTYLGGTNLEQANGIAVDGSGFAYVTGYTESLDFPTTGGAYQTAFDGTTNDTFVTKVNQAGTALVYSTYLGGSGNDCGNSIAVDGAGEAYVTGWTHGSFPTTPGAYQTVYGGGQDAFITKLNASGSALVYSTYLGGAGLDIGYGIALDGAGNAYVTGITSGSFPTTPGAYQTVYGGLGDAFITKMNAAGSALIYSTYLGGSGAETNTSLAVDGSGNVYVTGSTTGFFPTTAGAYQTVVGATGSLFITKLNIAGTALVYSTYLGGSSMIFTSFDNGIAVDGAGNAYVTGTVFGIFPTTPGAFQTFFGGGTDDVFVTKLNSSGGALAYSTYLGGSDFDIAAGIAVDGAGNCFVTGWTRSFNFPTTAGAFQPTPPGGADDGFVTELNDAGNALVYSTYFGGNSSDRVLGIALDNMGSFYVTGATNSTNFPTTAGAPQTMFDGGITDAFVAKFGLFILTATPTNTSASTCQATLNVSQNLFRLQAGGQAALTLVGTLCSPGNCSVKIYNSAGEHIQTLVDHTDQPAGSFQTTWDGKNKNGAQVASGVYILRMVEPLGILQARVAVIH
jgi:hypothetical protein